MFWVGDELYVVRQLENPALMVLLGGLDGAKLEVLEKERHIGTQHERYGIELPSRDAVGTLLIFVHLLVGRADQLG